MGSLALCIVGAIIMRMHSSQNPLAEPHLVSCRELTSIS